MYRRQRLYRVVGRLPPLPDTVGAVSGGTPHILISLTYFSITAIFIQVAKCWISCVYDGLMACSDRCKIYSLLNPTHVFITLIQSDWHHPEFIRLSTLTLLDSAYLFSYILFTELPPNRHTDHRNRPFAPL